MSSTAQQTALNGIAVVGMAGRFPGADSIDEFWRNLVHGVESISQFSVEELQLAGVDPQSLSNPDFVRARGLLTDPEGFDAAFFGIGPREAELMDPQQRLFLETCWHALEHAGLAPQLFPGSIGVWGGMSTGMTNSTYLLANLHAHGQLAPEDVLPAMLGNENDYLTTRVSYKLNLRGPSVNVQSACSTSLVAVAQACQSLLTWQCDAALAGGVSVSYPQKDGYLFYEGGIGSPDGHCRPFDARAAGTVFSNGVGVVVLRRLEDAVADGQTIYAVVRSAATNNDGAAKVSFAAPSVDGQAEVIATALAAADVEADTIDYVETHGTATPLGDPIEVAALTRAFRAAGATGRGFCGIGSVKSNVGHLDAAAGVAGFIKAVLALHHRQLPPTLHFERPNPKCDLSDSPFYVVDRLVDWPRHGHRRRAGVSSFGIGGTNAHVILEEAPDLPAAAASASSSEVLVLSARTPTALDAATSQLAAYLEAHPAVDIGAVSATLQLGRQPMSHRRIAVGSSPGDLAAALRGGDGRRMAPGVAAFGTRAVAFMFPGGGTQYVDMARQLLPHAPVFRESLESCLSWLRARRDVRSALFPDSAAERALAAERLEQPSWGLPALFAVEHALARQWMAWGVHPTALIGHSMGEYTAACLAGVMPLEDALALVLLRGRLFETLAPGGMLGVPLSETEVAPYLGADLAVAAINAPTSCVVSGTSAALATFGEELAAAGISCRRLRIAVAAHSPMVEPILDEFGAFVRRLSLRPPTIPVVSNLTGRWLTAEQACSPDYWTAHLRQTVRFADGVGTLLEEPNRVLLEVGPGQALSTFAHQHPRRTDGHIVQHSIRPVRDDAHDLAVLQLAAGRLWTAGVAIDWAAQSDGPRRRVALPGYPFERTRFFVAAPSPAAPPSVPGAAVPAAVEPVAAPAVMAHHDPSPAIARSRADRICDRLIDILHRFSGVPIEQIDPRVSFLEMGFDSLFLTQASLKFKAEFGVRVTFRQLFDDAPTLQALAAYIDGKMPPDAFPAPRVATAKVAVDSLVPANTIQAALPLAASNSAPPPVASSVERVIHEQLRLMAEQLRLLGGTAAIPATATHPAAMIADDAALPPDAGRGEPQAPASPAPVRAHGPFKPIDRNAASDLLPEQAAAIARWAERYVARTSESKRLATVNRPVLADARSISGFNRLWKEMVYPIVATRSEGSKIWDVDGNEYVDVVMGFGANLFGHRPRFVVDALRRQLDIGFEIGPLQAMAGDVARLIRELTGMQRVGFTNTGSEAVLAATRVARTITGRDKIAIFDGAYHGVFDEVLLRPLTANGETRTVPVAPGIPGSAITQVIVLEYGSPGSLEILRARGEEIAAVLVEPVQSRRLDLQPREFMHAVRAAADEIGAALIFDEVITGFRVHPGGAQAYFGVKADLATYGKVVGGGMPIGIVAGDATYMDALDGGQWTYGDDSFPEVGVTYFAGTFVRHPLSLAAAHAVLTHLKEAGTDLQLGLERRSAELAHELQALLRRYDAPLHLTQFSSVMHLHYPTDFRFGGLFYFLLRERGIHIWDGRPFFLTTAHTDADFAAIRRAFDESLAEMQAARFFGPSRPLGVQTPAQPTVVTQSTPDVVPFTEAQMELWLAAQMSPSAACSFNEVVAIDLKGPLDLGALQRALDQVVARHEALRMTVSNDPVGFRRHDHQTVTIDVRDLTALSPEEQTVSRDRAVAEGDGRAFDLERGPLVRVTLVRFAADRHVLVIAAHHLVCDGWSFGVVLNDLCLCYSAELSHERPTLEPALQASEYAHMLETTAARDEARTASEFWVSQLTTLPEPLELPADRARPAVRTHRGARLAARYPSPVAMGIKALATSEKVTLFTALLAAFEVVLHRLTGQDYFVVGIPIAAQSFLDNPNLVTHAVNFVPLPCTVDGTTTFRQLLSSLRQQSYDINEHQNCTYGSLLRALKLPRDQSRNPLVTVSFTLEPAIANLPLPGIRTELMTVARSTSKRDLHLNVMETGSELLVEVDYSTDLFDEATVSAWLSSYQTLIEAAVARPDVLIGELPLVSADERRALVERWNDSRLTTRGGRLIHAQVEHWAATAPDRTAVVCEDRRLTWATLNRRANQLARELIARGVTPGSRVGICLERSLDFVVALIAAHKARAAYVPLDPEHPSDRLDLLMRDAGLLAVITGQASPPAPSQFDVPMIVVDDVSVSRQPDHDLGLATAHDEAAYVVYTSGSTGQPKGVVVEHRHLLNYTAAIVERLGVPAGASYALVSTVAADLGNTAIFPALATGGVLHVVTPQRAASGHALAEYFAAHHIDVFKITPSHLGALVADNPARDLLPRCCLVLGGEGAHPSWVARLQALAPHCRIVNHYGPTETTVGALTYEVRGDAAALPGSTLPIGRPLGNVRAYVLDDHLAPVPVGVAGELYIGGAGVARGYLDRPELTRERFLPDPFTADPAARMYRTGDRARRLRSGDVEFLGRHDSQVKVRGFRLELGEVEATLRSCPGVTDAVVLLRQDSPGDPRLVAYVSGNGIELDALRAHAARSLPGHAVPAAFVHMPRWPLTANGKLDRQALPAPSLELHGRERGVVAPRTPTEMLVAEIWRDLLSVPAVGADDDFFLLGGHSLLAIRLAHRLHQAFGVSLPPGALFELSRLRDLAKYLEPAASANVSVARQPDPNRLLVRMAAGGPGHPFVWVHGVGGQVFSFMQLSQHLAAGRDVYGFAADWTQVFAPEDRVIDRIAARYVRELRGVRPRGPYHLGGFCSGAVLMIEIARQLEAAGEEIGAFAVLDYEMQRTPDDASPVRSAIAFARNLPRWVTDDAVPSGSRELVGRVKSRLRRAINRGAAADDIRDATGMWRFPDHQVEMLKVHHRVIHSFSPGPMNGRATLFLPRARPLFGPWTTGQDPGWERIARGGVDVEAVRGSHSTMLGGQFAAELAARLVACVERAELRLAATPAAVVDLP